MESGNGSCNLLFLGCCKFKKQLFITSIFSDCSLMDVFASLRKKYAEISSESIILQYVAPLHKMIVSLNDDDDVLNMIHLHICVKLTTIELRAEKRNEHLNNLNDGRVDEKNTQSKSDKEIEQAPCSNNIDAWINCIRGVGQTFKGAGEFRKCLKNFSVATRRSFVYVKNDNEKVIVICSEKSCDWRIYASKHKRDNLFAIRKCKLQHSCGENNLRSRGHPRADVYWIANVVKEKLRGEPSYRPCTMQMDLQRDFEVELEYRKVWKGKELAMHEILGTDEGCYDRLRWYCDAVKKTNPGSVVQCEIEPLTKKFRRLFICFHACAVGFVSGCRPLIFLDGTHIKNKYKGCILVAVSKDANDDLFTIAYAIVDAENDSNWDWFCYHVSRVLLYYQCIPFDEFTFFSDIHPSIIKAVNQVLRSYPRHNKNHWSSVFKKVVYAPSFQEYEQHINNIFESMPLARGFIKFEVVDGEKPFVVDLVDMTCSCRDWQINKLLCKHTCSAIETKALSVYDFCDKYFKIEVYRAAYKRHINLIPTFDINESCVAASNVIQDPSVRSQAGRRGTKRIPSQVNIRVSTCGRCHARGHNRRSCKEPIVMVRVRPFTSQGARNHCATHGLLPI
ncbi:uncharacterized protein [Henckelia pumila]|uniref:uncharacterized protein n=1 Tax=Henckelia pumila TaxID=405737 RepID=UPI003C6E9769